MLTKEDLPLIVGYLPYGLKIIFNDADIKDVFSIVGFTTDYNHLDIEYEVSDVCGYDYVDSNLVKPLLKPMEMFDKEAYKKWFAANSKEKQIKNIDEVIANSHWINNNMGNFYQFGEDVVFLDYCHSNHYDIHGLISKGKAIDWRLV